MSSPEERYAAGMIGKAATEGTERAPKEESFRHRHRRGGHRNFLPVPLQYSSLHLIPKVGLVRSALRPWPDKHPNSLGSNCMCHTQRMSGLVSPASHRSSLVGVAWPARF